MHFRVLDSWRGIAALLVALFHLNLYSAIYSLEFVRNAWLFVDFFFVLSGFVITHNYANRLANLEDLSTFAFKRFCRLWPLHAVVLLAFVLVESAKAFAAARGASFYNPPFTGPNSANTVMMNLGFAQSFGLSQQLTWNPPSWSICAEFWTYLIFAFAMLIASTWLRRIRFASGALVAVLLIGSVAILVAFSRDGMDATYDLGLVRCVYGFLVGHLTYRLWRAAPRAGVVAGSLEVAALVGMVIYVSLVGHSGYSFVAPLVFAAVVFVFAFEAGLVSRLMSNPLNEWLGRISYSIYMWQAFIIFNLVDRPVSVLEKLSGKVLTTTVGAGSALGSEAGKLIVLGGHLVPIVVTLAYLVLLVATASVSYRLFERPDPKLLAGFVRWRDERSRMISSYFH